MKNKPTILDSRPFKNRNEKISELLLNMSAHGLEPLVFDLTDHNKNKPDDVSKETKHMFFYINSKPVPLSLSELERMLSDGSLVQMFQEAGLIKES